MARGDCLAAKLRPGNVHSAEGWEELLLPEIERQQQLGKEVAFRDDAPFARPEFYEALEERGVKYAISFRPATAWSGTSRNCCRARWGDRVRSPWWSTRGSCTEPPVGRRPDAW